MSGYALRRPWTLASPDRRALSIAIVLLLSPASMLEADEIYKSVDANGTVVYSDHLDPSMPNSSIVHLDEPRYPPRELHFCWTNCFTLILENGVYRRADGTDETWTVEAFTAKSVVLHRHGAPAAWNGFSADVIYAGQAANDRLLGVTVNGKPTSGIDASWGIALNTLPGSNAERDAHVAAEPAADDAAVSTSVAPPPLADDPEPLATQDGYLWTPGCWYWGGRGYYWVPGAWVQPPRLGVLWTPAYWSFVGAVYVFHPGYWSAHVGFYGGINYGGGYNGNGFTGGRWRGTSFAYNLSVNHLNPGAFRSTYDEPVAGRARGNSPSYNGGPGGTTAIATSGELAAASERHIPAAAPRSQTVQRLDIRPAPPAMAKAGGVDSFAGGKTAVVNQPVVAARKALASAPSVEPQVTPTPAKNEVTAAPRPNRVTSARGLPKQ
jgi:hypothetical protein